MNGPPDSKPYSFDFSGDGVPLTARAADTVTLEDVRRLFEQLHAANALWTDPTRGPRGATLASLEAVLTFLHSNGENVGGSFSRPLDLLLTELRTAPAADPGNILPPWERGQTTERNRRKVVNYLKAAAAYAADRLNARGVKLEAACADVATVLLAHRFPVTEKQRQDGKLAGYIERCRARYARGEDEAAKFFQSFHTSPPVALTHFDPRAHTDVATSDTELLQWLARELAHGGYVR